VAGQYNRTANISWSQANTTKTRNILKIHVALAILCSLIFAIAPRQAAAHKLRLFVWGSNDIISVESGLSGGRHLVSCRVTVQNTATDDIIIEGVTNSKGSFSFPIPPTIRKKPVDMLIAAFTDEGHRAEWLLKKNEYGFGQAAQTVDSSNAKIDSLPVTGNKLESISRDELKEIIAEVLEKKLAPMRQQIAHISEKKTSIQDIFGGIGYLVGLAGLAIWLKRDDKSKSH